MPKQSRDTLTQWAEFALVVIVSASLTLAAIGAGQP
jgi:hypothetical protein